MYYCIKDQNDNFVDDNSIFYNKYTKKYEYSTSNKIINESYYYGEREVAEEVIDKLNKLNKKAKFDKVFQTVEFDLKETIANELQHKKH